MIKVEIYCDACNRRTPLDAAQGWEKVARRRPKPDLDMCPSCFAEAFGWKKPA